MVTQTSMELTESLPVLRFLKQGRLLLTDLQEDPGPKAPLPRVQKPEGPPLWTRCAGLGTRLTNPLLRAVTSCKRLRVKELIPLVFSGTSGGEESSEGWGMRLISVDRAIKDE